MKHLVAGPISIFLPPCFNEFNIFFLGLWLVTQADQKLRIRHIEHFFGFEAYALILTTIKNKSWCQYLHHTLGFCLFGGNALLLFQKCPPISRDKMPLFEMPFFKRAF